SGRVYRDLFEKGVRPLGFQCLRADLVHGQIVMEDVWVKITQAAFLIADVTGQNPNVMYEVGIAHAIGKPTVLLTQDLDRIPFDFKHLRHYRYEDNTEGARRLRELLRRVV